ncbi:hypothetical protein [Bacillus andreraoultii]|uniref:hypothetical protein n=1 Tax=Bacillus andreraoultii TaxID=1499685 RepID=UPI00053A079F|nr:hypothetical protein [Bacillus andreraoultii]
MANQKKWQIEIPSEVLPLIEDVENVTLKFVIEQCDWILEQSGGDTWYGDESEDEGVQEVRRYVKKYRRYAK